MGTYMPLDLKSKTFNQAHLHHTLGQNRPHQKTITHPQAPPMNPPQPDYVFFCGSEGLIRPPLPGLYTKDVPVIELLLYDQCYMSERTEKINKYG